jgi:hypothetical protein
MVNMNSESSFKKVASIFYVVGPDSLECSDISEILAMRQEIQTYSISRMLFIADKCIFTDASARKAEAIYINRLLHAWPDFLFFCSKDLATELQELLTGRTSGLH